MSRKTWIMLKRGLITDPKHRDQMGIRVWLYLYILDRCDWETGKVIEWRDEAEAEQMQMPVQTLRDQRRSLEAEGYIACEQGQHALRVTVLKWVNPREYSGKVYNPPGVAVSERPQGDKFSAPSLDEGCTQGDTQGDTQGEQLSAPLQCNSDSHIPESSESDGQLAGSLRQQGTDHAGRRQWDQARGQLQTELSKASFDTWVRDVEFVAFEDGLFTFGSLNGYARDWLESRLASTVRRILTGIVGQPVDVRFVVVPREECRD